MTTTVVKAIRVNHAGDGEWVMSRASGVFVPGIDVVFMAHRGQTRLGGFVFSGYLHASIQVHMAGDDPHWCSRDLMWTIFDYAFNQLAVRKVIAAVASTNEIAMAQDLRAGFQIEGRIKHAVPDGDLIILTMERHQCRWLKHNCKLWAPKPVFA
jgi:hypothetical protein